MLKVALTLLGSMAVGAALSMGWHHFSSPAVPAAQIPETLTSADPVESPPGPATTQARKSASEELRAITFLTGEFSRSLALLEALEGAEPEIVVTWIDTAVAELYGDDLVTITGLLYSYLADLDADLAIATALRAPLRQQERWLRSIFARLASIDLPDALERVSRLAPLQAAVAVRAILRERNDIESTERELIASQYGIEVAGPTFAANPYTRLRELVSDGNIETRASWRELSRLVYQLVTIDPEKALVTAFAIENKDKSRNIANMVLGYWGQRSPREPVDWVLNNNMEDERVFEFAQMAFMQYAQREPLEAWQLSSYVDPAQTDMLRINIIGELARVDPEMAIYHLNELRSRDSLSYRVGDASIRVASVLLQRDTQRAVELLTGLKPSFTQQHTLAYSMIDTTPERAFEILETIDDQTLRNSLTANLVSQWTQGQTQKSKKLVKSLPLAQRAELNPNLVQELLMQDPIRAIEYASELSADEGRDEALIRAASLLRISLRRGRVSEASLKDIEQRMLDAVIDPEQRTNLQQALDRTRG